MKANAPEKLYFGERDKGILELYFGESDKGILDIYSTKESDNEVEYTRTDAFIEKACEFISLNIANYIDVTHKGGIEHLALQERFIDAFKKYMEGE